jgi:ribose transport system substrate-binding protein
MKTKSSLRFVVLLAISLLAIGGCRTRPEANATNWLSLPTTPPTFGTIARKGTEKAAAELPNADIEFKINSDNTAAEQQRIVEALLAQGTNGIAISPSIPSISYRC